MSNYLRTARPLLAAISWVSNGSLFCEIPCRGDGPPVIVRYAATVAGLQSALNVLLENPSPQTTTIQRDHPMLKKVASTPDSVRAQASAIVSAMLLKGKAQ